MKYVVIRSFSDAQDGRHKYGVGDEFPRPNLEVTKERIEELSTEKNRRGVPLIEACRSRRKRGAENVDRNIEATP